MCKRIAPAGSRRRLNDLLARLQGSGPSLAAFGLRVLEVAARNPSLSNVEDLFDRLGDTPIPTGSLIGRLTVVGPAPRCKRGRRRYFCICRCGREKVASHGGLRSRTSSCGCAVKGANVYRVHTHGHAGEGPRRAPEYRIWSQMIDRCTNPNNEKYDPSVGLSEAWRTDFGSFLSSVGHRPGPGTDFHLLRIHQGRGWVPGNVRWMPVSKAVPLSLLEPVRLLGHRYARPDPKSMAAIDGLIGGERHRGKVEVDDRLAPLPDRRKRVPAR